MKTAVTFRQLQRLMHADLTSQKPNTPTLLGEPGIGKSKAVEDLARQLKTKVFTLPVNQVADKTDLTGVRTVQSETGSWKQISFPHAIIMDCIDYANANPDETPILFLDEFNRATADVTSAILSFTTLRRVGTVDFPSNVLMVMAGNDEGNIIAIDDATTTRFSVYHVKPDIDTFLGLQQWNPFIQDVLTKHPEDLLAPAVTETPFTSEDDDADNEKEFEFSSLEFTSEENFKQLTVPRTIENLHHWLNALGINKSGSDKEKETLSDLITDTTGEADQSKSVLMVGIEAHVGRTNFAVNVFNAIHEHFYGLINQTTAPTVALLSHLRPDQDVINQLSKATDMPTIESIVGQLSEPQQTNTLVWLMENASVKEINNNDAVTGFIQTALNSINGLNNEAIRDLTKVLQDSTRTSKVSLKILVNSNAPSIAQYIPMFKIWADEN